MAPVAIWKRLPPADPANDLLDAHRRKRAAFDRWMRHNILPHYDHGYVNVSISIKALGRPPGDAVARLGVDMFKLGLYAPV
jgi:hypothetical protein